MRRLRADMIEVYKILRGFKGIDEAKFFQTGVGCTKCYDQKRFKKRVNLDAGKFS